MLKWTFSSMILCVHLDCFLQINVEKWNGRFKGGKVLEFLVQIFQKPKYRCLPSTVGLPDFVLTPHNSQADFHVLGTCALPAVSSHLAGSPTTTS